MQDHGKRLDQYLAEAFPEFSRARLQLWLKQGDITHDGNKLKPSYRLRGTEKLAVDVSFAQEPSEMQAQDIALDIVHEDEHLLLVNKPAGLVVHPASGNWDGTLVNALLYHCAALKHLPRAGLVHRLDKLTSGILVVAKTLSAHTSLVRQLQKRSMSREYVALVHGRFTAGGLIDEPIARHPKDRKRMAVVAQGKAAVTHYRLEQRFRDFSLLQVNLETGRTHQIRVHMTHLKHPLVGDPVYGGRPRLPAGAGEVLLNCLSDFKRQALHARKLSFIHPETQQQVSYEAPIPVDMLQLFGALRHDESQYADHA